MTNDSPYQPAPEPTAPAAQPATGVSLGFVSFLVGAGTTVLGFLFTVVQAVVFGTGNYGALGLVGGAIGFLSFVGGIVALVIGLIVLLRRGRSRPFAAAGAALGGALVLGSVGSWLYSGLIVLMSAFPRM